MMFSALISQVHSAPFGTFDTGRHSIVSMNPAPAARFFAMPR